MRRFEESIEQPASGTPEPDKTTKQPASGAPEPDKTTKQPTSGPSKPGKSMEMPKELGTCTDRPFIGPPGASAVLSFNSSHGIREASNFCS